MEDFEKYKSIKVIISGGGTGGHIFPAIAIANAIKELVPSAEFLFVGAQGKMEMEKVPKAGFSIVGLPIAGIQRSFTIDSIVKNLKFPFLLLNSLFKARSIVKSFQPDVVIGVGGYASGPVLWAAQQLGIPTLIQEQNSYAGLTNKWLSKNAKKICVAYENMETYFPKTKIANLGNPVRADITQASLMKLPAMMHFKLSAERKTILVIGGSLGARTINESVANGIEEIKKKGYQLIWQTGKNYYPKAIEICKQNKFSNGWGEPKVVEFISEMNLAYGAADIVISRAGALSISELSIIGKAVILVPSPNVAEDHQTKNALNLANQEAAIMLKDSDAKENLMNTVFRVLEDNELCSKLDNNITALGKPNAAKDIALEVLKLIKR